ncbi:hypothetical protein MMC22_003824 [Lobaria immixta]|nr:hypothetical protein [Lobaria immixta]
MVYYFTSNVVAPAATIYVGKDKFESNKQDNVKIIYTPWSNLHKNASMATGQVGFHDPRKTRTLLVPNRLNATINRLQKTRAVVDADELPALKETHLAGLRARANAAKKALRKEEERVARERKEDKWRREHAYEELMHADDGGSVGRSNEQGWDEDDFM